MSERTFQWPNKPPDAPEQPPRQKRRSTPATIIASRTNGAKSKGCTTDAGRAKVKFNAVTHGATCKKIIFLAGENPTDFWDWVNRIVIQEGAQGELEIEAIITAAYSRVTKERAINSGAIAVNQSMAEIEDHFHDGQQAEVDVLIPQLVQAPAATVTQLMNSTCGCKFLIREFTSLADRLVTHTGLEVSQREYCLRLAGHRPEDLLTDPVVRDFNRAYLGSLHGPGVDTIDTAANCFIYDRPESITVTEYTLRMQAFVTDLPTIQQGWNTVKKFVHDRLARLEERLELVTFREQRALTAALGVAQCPCDHAADKRERYSNNSDRTYATHVRLLQALRKERRKYQDRGLVDPNDDHDSMAADMPHEGHEMPDAGSAAAETAPAPGVAAERQNGPGATQTVDPVGSNDPVAAARVVAAPDVAPDDADPKVAIIKRFHKEFDHLRDYDLRE